MATHIWKCQNCGLIVELADITNVYHDCPNEPPRLMRRIKNFTSAVVRWHRAGRPLRTDEEVKDILKNHCEVCEFNENSICIHKHCGCRVNTSNIPLFNKIKMATENCPIRKW